MPDVIIDDHRAEALAELTGESLTEAVIGSLEMRLVEVRQQRRSADDLVERFSQLPVVDPRSAEDIVGYDDHGLPE